MSEGTLMVYLGDVHVGWLLLDGQGRVCLHFAKGYRDNPDHPVLGQKFEDNLTRVYCGKSAGQLPPYFANLLPEGTLRELLEKSLGLPSHDDLMLLAAIASDFPGAVVFKRTEDGLDIAPPHDDADEVGDTSHQPLRFSLAGVQLKFSVLRNGSRVTLPARGQGGDWIVKIGSPQWPGLVENEFAMLEWARLIGLTVPENFIVEARELDALKGYIPDGVRGLAIRRYDRDGARRIHQEDFAQVLGFAPANKYDHGANLLLALVSRIVGPGGTEEMLKRLVFTVASGNADAHLKNWSLLYRDGVTPSLAPVYDQVATVAWPVDVVDDKLALSISGTFHFAEVTLERFVRLLARVDWDKQTAATLVEKTVQRIREEWKRVTGATQMLDEHVQNLRAHWQRVPLLREAGGLP